MRIDEPLILRLEKLARLQLSPSERNHIQKDLNAILEMVEKLWTVSLNRAEQKS